ncbi:hypothetical protein DH2020_027121 [Rehmannia glutinosa]|uniref:RNase H type-1 domain-containing protein n=1 Tax=Rehmannia glutinosa TaxID=99300 RepID=A0ABR0VXZ4_REHGL
MEFFRAASPIRIPFLPVETNEALLATDTSNHADGDADGHALFSMLLWCAWGAQNDVNFEKHTRDHQSYFALATSRLFEHEQASALTGGRTEVSLLDKWSPPDPNSVKINTDASIREGEGSGIGVAIRDHRGQIVVTMSRVYEMEYDVAIAEAIACREGMRSKRFDHLDKSQKQPKLE